MYHLHALTEIYKWPFPLAAKSFDPPPTSDHSEPNKSKSNQISAILFEAPTVGMEMGKNYFARGILAALNLATSSSHFYTFFKFTSSYIIHTDFFCCCPIIPLLKGKMALNTATN